MVDARRDFYENSALNSEKLNKQRVEFGRYIGKFILKGKIGDKLWLSLAELS